MLGFGHPALFSITTNMGDQRMKAKKNQSTMVHKTSWKRYLSQYWQFYAMLIVPLAYFILFKYVPMFGNILAFRRFRPLTGPYGVSWVGLRYFKQFLGQPQFWNAFRNSMSYELVGDCYGTEAGLAQNLTFSCMDITSVTAVLKERSLSLLEKRVEEAEKLSDVYDENMQYREDFVLNVLYDAAVAALEEDAGTMTTELTVNMVYQNETWWIIADRNLLDTISGGILY